MRVFILGGTGFIGTQIVRKLLADGHEVVGLARHEEAFDRFEGRVAAVGGDITKPLTYRGHLLDCDASINLVGLIREKKRRGLTYERVVVQGTRNWIRECQEANVKRVVYISALGADPKGTSYQRTKWAAEQAVRNADLEWTIFRPSFVSGKEGAIPQFSSLFRLKIVPVWGKQNYFFDPVDVGDLAAAIVRSLKSAKARRRLYPVGGPDRLTYKEMLDVIAKAHGRKPWFVRMPWFMAYAIGATLGLIPSFPATLENFQMLRGGSAAPDQEWIGDLGIQPRRFRESVESHVNRKGR